MKTILKTLSLCLAYVLVAFQVQAQDSTAVQPQRGDLDFAAKAMASNAFEIQAANIALQKSQNETIKHYAQMMVSDHTAAGEQLTALVQQKNWELGKADDQKYEQMIQQLNDADAASFDQLYADLMAQTHTEAIELFKQAAEGNATTDNELKQFANEKIPGFQSHLDQIKTFKPTKMSTDIGDSVPNPKDTTHKKPLPKR